jgi:hypothetical protein
LPFLKVTVYLFCAENLAKINLFLPKNPFDKNGAFQKIQAAFPAILLV